VCVCEGGGGGGGGRERDFIRNDAIDIETAPALRLCEASGRRQEREEEEEDDEEDEGFFKAPRVLLTPRFECRLVSSTAGGGSIEIHTGVKRAVEKGQTDQWDHAQYHS
jgi:hypothetical protein